MTLRTFDMWSSRRSVLLQTVSLGAATFAFDRAVAQNYPSRPVKLILASPPGGPQDIAVRLLAERLSLAFGQPFVTEISLVELAARLEPPLSRKLFPTATRCWGPCRRRSWQLRLCIQILDMTQRETSCRLDRSSVARSCLQSTPGFQSIRSAILSIMRKQTRERSTTLRPVTARHPIS